MTRADLVISIGAYVTGAGLLLAAWRDLRWFFELPKPAWLVERCGRPAARSIVAVVGLVVIGMGVMIQLGIRPFP
ncbi:MAG: Imm17 family immunity protein [Pirellulales bacterium]